MTVQDMSAFAMTFNKDASRLVVGWARTASELATRSGSLTWWDTATGAEVGPTRKLNYLPTDLAVSPDGKALVVCGLDSHVTVWDMESHESTNRGVTLTGSAGIVAFVEDGKVLLTVRKDGAIQFWHWPTCLPVGHTFLGGESATGVAFTPDRRLLVRAILEGDVVPVINEWPLPGSPAEPPTIQQQAKVDTGLEIVEDNQVKPLTIEEWATVRHSLKVGSGP
jgi:WD40 repeat protein